MDDKRFDDIIKDKVGEYEPAGYDPSALAGLHYRMASEYSAPWYIQYRSEMLVGAAAVVIALILLWGQWGISSHNNDILQNQLSQLKDQNDELLAIKDQLGNLKPKTDTVRIIEYKSGNEPLYASLMSEINTLKNKIDENSERANLPNIAEKQLLYMGRAGELPVEAINSLRKDHDVVRQGDYMFLVLEGDLRADNTPYLRRKGLTNDFILPEYEFVIDSNVSIEDNIIARVKSQPVQISVKKLRDIEKHYQKGIGIELGPVAEAYRANYTPGTLETSYSGGLMANFITSPTLGIETGIIFHGTEYEVHSEDINKLTTIQGPRSNLGVVKSAAIKSWFFEIPVNLKYRYRLNQKHHFVLSGGWSPLLYTKQSVEYAYLLDVTNDLSVPVESSFREKEIHFNLGTANAAIGLSRLLDNNKRVETSLFYKRSLSGIGIEDVDAQFMGVRATYQFTLK